MFTIPLGFLNGAQGGGGGGTTYSAVSGWSNCSIMNGYKYVVDSDSSNPTSTADVESKIKSNYTTYVGLNSNPYDTTYSFGEQVFTLDTTNSSHSSNFIETSIYNVTSISDTDNTMSISSLSIDYENLDSSLQPTISNYYYGGLFEFYINNSNITHIDVNRFSLFKDGKSQTPDHYLLLGKEDTTDTSWTYITHQENLPYDSHRVWHSSDSNTSKKIKTFRLYIDSSDRTTRNTEFVNFYIDGTGYTDS